MARTTKTATKVTKTATKTTATKTTATKTTATKATSRRPPSKTKAATAMSRASTAVAEVKSEHSFVDPDEQRHYKLQRTRAKSLMDLDPMEREFCIRVAQGQSPVDAAAGANFPSPAADAKKLMNRVGVQRALRTLFEKNMEISEVTREEIIHGFRDAIAIARQMADPRTMIAGYRELGLMHGMYEAKVKIEITGGAAQIAAQMQTKTDAELLKVIQENSRILSAEEIEGAEDAEYVE
ncbi:hypothetical protein ACK0NM_21910 [Pseudomonas aeruginosa]|uniref:hypothetical protein n=1 Tax=Pseudomonas aeruginosa TaxID=287 RepID=UPI003907F5CF